MGRQCSSAPRREGASGTFGKNCWSRQLYPLPLCPSSPLAQGCIARPGITGDVWNSSSHEFRIIPLGWACCMPAPPPTQLEAAPLPPAAASCARQRQQRTAASLALSPEAAACAVVRRGWSGLVCGHIKCQLLCYVGCAARMGACAQAVLSSRAPGGPSVRGCMPGGPYSCGSTIVYILPARPHAPPALPPCTWLLHCHLVAASGWLSSPLLYMFAGMPAHRRAVVTGGAGACHAGLFICWQNDSFVSKR